MDLSLYETKNVKCCMKYLYLVKSLKACKNVRLLCRLYFNVQTTTKHAKVHDNLLQQSNIFICQLKHEQTEIRSQILIHLTLITSNPLFNCSKVIPTSLSFSLRVFRKWPLPQFRTCVNIMVALEYEIYKG